MTNQNASRGRRPNNDCCQGWRLDRAAFDAAYARLAEANPKWSTARLWQRALVEMCLPAPHGGLTTCDMD